MNNASAESLTVSERDVIGIIMGGGAGTRLFPLTKDRAKPAVPLAAKYRLVDIPISNCINSGLRRIFLLTQYNSSSLHRHVQQSYRFDDYSRGFVEIMAAQQTPSGSEWYQGTADAVRQNLSHFANHSHDLVLILSGDQLYRMDYRRIIQQHRATYADITVATIPVRRDAAKGFGIMHVDQEKRITRFVEKPKDEALLDSLKLSEQMRSSLGTHSNDDLFLASMGIYVFNRSVLENALSGTENDFGKDIIPRLIEKLRVNAYVYQGYWEDIGTIRAFYDANLDLCEVMPKFNFFDVAAPIYTRARYLPASKINRSRIEKAVIADGCIVVDATIEHTVLGIRSRVNAGATVKDSIIMGQDYYETDAQILSAEARKIPRIGIGANTFIERAIVDKNARIGDNVRLSPVGKPSHVDGDCYYIRDGIIVIPKGAVVPDGTVV
jgi:glucose-1-phosphate adenylyltransferase